MASIKEPSNSQGILNKSGMPTMFALVVSLEDCTSGGNVSAQLVHFMAILSML